VTLYSHVSIAMINILCMSILFTTCFGSYIFTLSFVSSWKTSSTERESAFVAVDVVIILVVVGGGSVVGRYRRDLLALLTCWRRLIGEGLKEGGPGTEGEKWVESR